MFYEKNSKHNPEKPCQDRASPNRVCMKKPDAGTVLTIPTIKILFSWVNRDPTVGC